MFEAWLNPDVVQRWMFVSDDHWTRVVSRQHVGGRFSVLERSHGEDIDHFGEFLEIEACRRIVFTLEVPKHFPGVTHVTVEIAPYAEGSAMTFTQAGVKKELTEESWRQMFERLAEVLAERSS